MALERVALMCSEQRAVRWYRLLPAGGTCSTATGGAKQGQRGYCRAVVGVCVGLMRAV